MAEEVAQQKSPEETAQQIIADNSTEQAEPAAVVQTEQPENAVPEQPNMESLIRETIKAEMGREQGRMAQMSGQKFADMESRMESRFSTLLEPLLVQANEAEKERLLNLGQDELAEMVLQGRAATAAPQQIQQEQPNQYLTALATASQELIIEKEDPRIWEGWQKNMSVTKSIELAKQNIEKLAGKTVGVSQQGSANQQPAPTNGTPPSAPSTQGAPQKSIRTISTISEAAQMFADGKLDSNQYRAAKKQIRSDGSATL
jgi:hypothetical protein